MKHPACPRGHVRTPENTRYYKGAAVCKICDKDRQKNRRVENKFKELLAFALFQPGDVLVACFVTMSDAVKYKELHQDLIIRKL